MHHARLVVFQSQRACATNETNPLQTGAGNSVDPYIVDLDAAIDHRLLPEDQLVTTWA